VPTGWHRRELVLGGAVVQRKGRNKLVNLPLSCHNQVVTTEALDCDVTRTVVLIIAELFVSLNLRKHESYSLFRVDDDKRISRMETAFTTRSDVTGSHRLWKMIVCARSTRRSRRSLQPNLPRNSASPVVHLDLNCYNKCFKRRRERINESGWARSDT